MSRMEDFEPKRQLEPKGTGSACFAVRFSMLNPIIAPSLSIPRRTWTCMHSCSASHRTTCCRHPLHHNPDTHAPERILAVLMDKKVRLQEFLGVSSRFGAVQFRVQLVPVNA